MKTLVGSGEFDDGWMYEHPFELEQPPESTIQEVGGLAVGNFDPSRYADRRVMITSMGILVARRAIPPIIQN